MLHRVRNLALITVAFVFGAVAYASAKTVDVPVNGFPTLGNAPIGRFTVPETSAPFINVKTGHYRTKGKHGKKGKLKRFKYNEYGVDLVFTSCSERVLLDAIPEEVPLNEPVTSVVPPVGTHGVTLIGDGPLSNTSATAGGIAIDPIGHWSLSTVALGSGSQSLTTTLGYATYDTAFRMTAVIKKKHKKKKIKLKTRVTGLVTVQPKSSADPLAACSDPDHQAALTVLHDIVSGFQVLDSPA